MPRHTGEVKTKSENKQAIYRFILRNGASTKQDIYTGLELSLPTIKQGLELLEKENLITAAGKIANTGGRSAVAYQIAEDSFYSIGIYISQHHLTAVCVNLAGEVIHSKRSYFVLNLQSDTYLKIIGDLVEDIKNALQIPPSRFLGVGIAVPSLVSEDGENIIFGMTTDFTGITREVLAKYIPYPVWMYHDSHTAAFAELWQNPSLKNAIYLNLNNSIGSSIIIDGQIYNGNNHLAGELGHMVIQSNSGKRCYSGKIGCLDTMCSATVLDSYTDGNLKQFFDLLDKQDEQALQIWDTYLDNLALAIHNIRMLLDCTFIIGGYVGSYIGIYISDLRRRVDALNIFTRYASQYVIPCSYKIEATAAGAALLVIDQFISKL